MSEPRTKHVLTDAVEATPRRASRRLVEGRLNCIALALNAAHEQLSELRHDLRAEERIEVPRSHVLDGLRR